MNRIAKNIILSACSRVVSIFASFLMIPLIIHGAGVETYGAWAVLASIATWMIFFDFGVGNALKNSIASESSDAARSYHTAFSFYTYLGIAFLAGSFALYLFDPFEDIQKISLLALYLPLFLFFPLRLFSFIMQGLRLVGLNSVFEMARVLVWLLGMYLYVSLSSEPQILGFALLFVVSIVVPQVVQFIVCLNRLEFVSNIKFISLRELIGENQFRVGAQFFVLQLTSLVLFNLGNVLIYKNFGAEQTASYDVLNKVFVSVLSVFNMGIAALWPELTRAYSLGQVSKCKKIYYLLLAGSIGLAVFLFGVGVNFPIILQLLGLDSVLAVPPILLWSVVALTALQSLAYCGAVVMNAVNVLHIQIRLAIFSIALLAPFFYIFKYLGFQAASYPLASCCLVGVTAIVCNFYSKFRILENVVPTKKLAIADIK